MDNTNEFYEARICIKKLPRLSDERITTTEGAVAFIRQKLGKEPQENNVVLAMDNNLRPVAMRTVSIGTDHKSLLSVKAIMQFLMLEDVPYFVMFHNHPNYQPKPSEEDLAGICRLIVAGELCDVTMLDSCIVGEDDSFYSIKENHPELFNVNVQNYFKIVDRIAELAEKRKEQEKQENQEHKQTDSQN